MQIIPVWDQLDLAWHNKVAYLTYQFLKLPQMECPLEHIFEDEWYIREIIIPKETLFLGRAHRHGHECQLLTGAVVHISEGGKQVIEAPAKLHTQPGYHMVLYALEDCIGRSIHPNPTHSRDIDVLENEAFESVASLEERGAAIARTMELEWQA